MTMNLHQHSRELLVDTYSSVKSRNFNLTECQFIEMLNDSVNGHSTFLKLLFEEHYSICKKYLVKYFQLCEDDANDATMDALLELWDKISKKKINYGNLSFLFTKMAFQHFIRSETKRKRLDIFLVINAQTHEDLDYCLDCAQKAFERLSPSERELITSYYIDDQTMVNQAKIEKINVTTIRKRKQRAVECLKCEFYRIFDSE